MLRLLFQRPDLVLDEGKNRSKNSHINSGSAAFSKLSINSGYNARNMDEQALINAAHDIRRGPKYSSECVVTY